MQRDEVMPTGVQQSPEGVLLMDAIPPPGTVWIVVGGTPAVTVKHGASFTRIELRSKEVDGE